MPDRLTRYREKRSPGATPEPFGEGERGEPVLTGGNLFVFHKHHARNLHWDLRLELDGALESWAVPKGPSPDPADKRLAMHVEPHPLDYAEFEGVIPEGEYGAGPSIVWDKGTWIAKNDPHEGLASGKLLFELRGYKVRGLWTLVHTPKRGERHWLLIKETGDAYVDRESGTEGYADDSIYSGLEVDELPRAEERAAELREQAAEAGADRRKVRPEEVRVMKATGRDDAFDDPDWVFEIKYDGYRLVAGRDDEDQAVLISRNGNDLTATFPEVARAVDGLLHPGLVMDGEVVVHDASGIPSFGRLQKRGRLQNRRDIARAALELPATYYAFDLLGLGDLDLRGLALLERKALLRELLPSVGPIRYSDHIPEQGSAVYEQVTAMDLEGVVAKRADSPYRAGRSTDWYKIRTVRTDDFVVVGWTEPKGSRAGFGSLQVAQYRAAGGARADRDATDGGPGEAGGPADGAAGGEGATHGGAAGDAAEHGDRIGVASSAPRDELVWTGSVGTGYSADTIARLMRVLEPLEELLDEAGGFGQRDIPPLVAPEGSQLPKGRDQHWVAPELVIEVQYREVTEAGVLRHPSFLRVRDDKPAEECRVRDDEPVGHDALPEPPAPEALPEDKSISFTNLDKVFWPATGGGAAAGGEGGEDTAAGGGGRSAAPAHPAYTKGDLIDYYDAIWPWLEPYLADRPLVLTRYPDGIHGKSFYQKDAPVWAPDWIDTVTVQSGSGEKELNYFVARDRETLLYLANLGTIPLHIWHSRTDALDQPDWCLLDLDPKDAPFSDVVEIALFLHDLCDDIDLPHFVKTSGSSGLHVLIPLGRQMDYDQCRALGELLARVVVQELPEIATVERVVRKRAGKVYVDFLQNRRGQLVVAPFSVRAKPGATVSAPLRWKEVGPKLAMRDYTITSMPRRMRALKEGDPLRPVLDEAPDLLAALEGLQRRV